VTLDLGSRPGNGAGTAGTTTAAQLVDSTPYPWPWDGQFRPQRCALLVIEAATPPLPADDGAWAVIYELAQRLSSSDGFVVQALTARPPRLTEAAPAPTGTVGPTSPSRLGADAVIAAPGWDAFFDTPLDTVLRAARRDLLLLVGGWLEVGVHSTMRSANDRGYECLLVPAGCIAIDDTTRTATISSTEMSGGIFGAVAGPSSTSTLFPCP
jgi:Isochorismatase family